MIAGKKCIFSTQKKPHILFVWLIYKPLWLACAWIQWENMWKGLSTLLKGPFSPSFQSFHMKPRECFPLRIEPLFFLFPLVLFFTALSLTRSERGYLIFCAVHILADRKKNVIKRFQISTHIYASVPVAAAFLFIWLGGALSCDSRMVGQKRSELHMWMAV